MPILYVVATPIGNLEDITLRALRVLKEAGLIAAEDTRVTRKLLSRYDIHTPLTSYHEHNKNNKLTELLNALEDTDVALVSDAGMPGINDPGYELVREADKAGFRIVPIPGASALTSALAVSGLPVEQFIYLGFMPRKQSERLKLLESLASEERTLFFFESPRRLRKTLEDVLHTLGDRRIALCREMTKLHEEVFRGTLSEAVSYFVEPRGEFTVIIQGRDSSETDGSDVRKQEKAVELLSDFRHQGMRAKEAVAKTVGIVGLPRRTVYQLWLSLRDVRTGRKEKE